jgi:hypothetical protein
VSDDRVRWRRDTPEELEVQRLFRDRRPDEGRRILETIRSHEEAPVEKRPVVSGKDQLKRLFRIHTSAAEVARVLGVDPRNVQRLRRRMGYGDSRTEKRA